MTAAAFLLGVGLAFSALTAPLEALVGPEAHVRQRVNEVRRTHHLQDLRGSPDLARVAGAHAEDMARHGYLAHVDLAGRNPLERTRAAGVEGFRLLAENIGASSVGGDRVEAVVAEWLRSPVHRENLLNPAFNHTGIGVAERPDGPTVYVQLFAAY
jgi:uncharacterized protein YkwD